MKHKPNPTADHSDGQVIAAYAVATRPGNMDPDFEVMDRATIDRYRGYSRSRSGPWDTHYVEMAEKTVLKQLLKRLPKSVTAPPEPPPELLMAGYDLVAPDGLEGVINNPALQERVIVPETAAPATGGMPAKQPLGTIATPTLPRAKSPTRTNRRKCRRRPMTKTTIRRFRRGVQYPTLWQRNITGSAVESRKQSTFWGRRLGAHSVRYVSVLPVAEASATMAKFN